MLFIAYSVFSFLMKCAMRLREKGNRYTELRCYATCGLLWSLLLLWSNIINTII